MTPRVHPATAAPGDYARSALRRGMELKTKIGVNPYKFGMIGSTDAHTGFAAVDEGNFLGKQAIDTRLVDKQMPYRGMPLCKRLGYVGFWACRCLG